MLQISQGETFVTQTDTEVVPKLCKVVYNRLHKLDMQVTFTQVRRSVPNLLVGVGLCSDSGPASSDLQQHLRQVLQIMIVILTVRDPLTQVLMEVVSQLEGAFALLIRSTRFPDELMAAKKGSPLLVGERPALLTTHQGI